jgi:lipid-A-disaccharide synthase
MPSLCFVAGDPSGDAHAAALIRALRAKLPSLQCSGLGGPAMQAAGMALLDDLTKASAIGPFDASRYLGRFLRARRLLAEHLDAQRPDLVILVDFGDFNLPVLAPLVKRRGLPILYYISPQLWAWGRFRIRLVRRYVDRMVVFFPFEESLYRKAGVAVTWVGHPLVDGAKPTLTLEQARERFNLNPWRRTLGLLPGSREREIDRHLPLMLAAARRIAWHMPGIQFLLPKAPTMSATALHRHLNRARLAVRVAAEGSIHDALQAMEAAVVASGTATLEAALSGIPMVVVYRASWPTYWAARAVIRIPHIALVNVVAGRRLVPELVQRQATARRVADAAIALLRDESRGVTIREGLREVRERLGEPGAVDRAAEAVLGMLAEGRVRAAEDRS